MSRTGKAALSNGPSPSQDRAIVALLAGETVTAAAAEAGVTRRTLHNWLSGDPAFIAALNRARAEQADAFRARLHGLAAKAISAVEAALDAGDTRAALAVLRGIGLLDGRGPRIGPTSEEDVDIDLKEREKRRASDRFLADFGL